MVVNLFMYVQCVLPTDSRSISQLTQFSVAPKKKVRLEGVEEPVDLNNGGV